MKNAYALFSAVFIISFIALIISLSLNITSYTPRIVSDTHKYLQGKILASNGKNLAKYFLYIAKNDNKECLNSISFNYPSINDTIRIDYFYAFGECENFVFKNINSDVNLSKDGVITANISVSINANKGVNEEIFINKKYSFVAKEAFFN
ncbi:hypothetical protein [Campylobacter sp. LR286c]|uniref:hypothetical protein n=1 Tax=Campylobacter sp. LR286c TaxID=2593545 RepID=UPI001237EAC5|nr:hypothetical protein [Campylobacter sp. LR286c]KAA6227684.1 hypothetical protein FMM57_03875 [Campylobacter sp. LR286c]